MNSQEPVGPDTIKPENKPLMTKPGKTGLARLFAATGYSMQGLRAAWKHEEAFRIEATLACLCVPLAFWVGRDLTHKLLLVICCGLVIIAELVNSAIEAAVDRFGSEQHPLSGQAKDIGSAVVFTSLVLFLIVWIPSLWQRFFV
ncbi:MAG TPA: diacylglycerol kinase [Spongiibacteraceae bacterium]|nr:diacylglycerol kinase [Spongiibacteraceae bacterium]